MKHRRNSDRFGKFLIAGIATMLLSGCKDPETQISDIVKQANKTNIQKALSFYMLHIGIKAMRPPKNEEELRTFIMENEDATRTLERMGVDRQNYDQYMIGRDNEPFIINYSVSGQVGPNDPGIPIVFESKGVDGVRQVAFNDRTVLDISDDSEYLRLMDASKRTKRNK